MEKDKKPAGRFFVDAFHIVLILLLYAYIFYTALSGGGGGESQGLWKDLAAKLAGAGTNDVLTFIGAVAFTFFGIIGIYEYMYANGFSKLLPSFFVEFKETKEEETAKTMMKTYYEQDIAFIQEYEDERVRRILQALKIDEEQFHHIQYELVRARAMPEKTLEDMQKKLEKLIYQPEFIIDQSKTTTLQRVYPNVDYYINLYTALYDPQLCDDVGRIMAGFITQKLQDDIWFDLDDIDYIMVPYGSNLLLGLQVGSKLGKPVLAMQEMGRVCKDEPWDGNYQTKGGGKNNIIVIHDVLVTSKRIQESVGKLPPDTYMIAGVYCLLQYDCTLGETDKKELQKLFDHYAVHCLIHTQEDILKARKENRED